MIRKSLSRRVTFVLLAALILPLIPASPAGAQSANVTLSSSTSPTSGQPGVHVVAATGSGFPAGVIDPSAVTVRLAPLAPGAGPSAQTFATTVTTVVGSTRRVSFLVPSTLIVGGPTNYQVTLAGATNAGVQFQSGNSSLLVINPPATILSATPNGAFQGAVLPVGLVAQYTNFVQGSTQASFGPGIRVGGGAPGAFGPVTVLSATQAQAQITIDAAASLGPRAVQIKTGAQEASKPAALSVLGPTVIALEPAQLTVAAGGSGSLTVRIQNADPSRATHIALSSSDSAVAGVPAEVVLPAGATEGLVPIAGGVPGGPTQITAALNGSSASAEVTVRERPLAPSLTEPLVEGALVVAGTGTANALLDVQVDGVAAGFGTVGAGGQFSVNVPALHAGQIVTATQTVGDLTSPTSAPVTVRARPPAPTVTAPLFEGSTQVSGTGVANASIDLFVNGAAVASGMAAASGAFTILVPALVVGQQMTATQTSAGVTSIASAPVTVIAVPPAPTVIAPLVEGASTISGTGIPGASVEVFVENAAVGTTIVGGTNSWLLPIATPLVAGQRVKARQTVGSIISDFSPELVVVARPPKPTIASPLVEGGNSISGGGVVGASVRVFVDAILAGTTSVGVGGIWTLALGTPLVAGQAATADQTVGGIQSDLSDAVVVLARPPAPLVNGPLVEGSTTVTGAGIPGATLDLFVAGGAAGSATVAGGGTWTVLLGVALVAGQSVQARQTVGVIVSSFSAPLIVLSRPPAPTINAPLFAGGLTVQGAGVIGASLEVFKNAVSVGTTAVGATGTWSLPLAAALVAGDVITAKQTVAGVASPLSAPVTVQAALTTIEIVPAPTAALNVGQSIQFSARGIFSDASIQDPLVGAIWSSDAGAIVSIDTGGLATAHAAGLANIRASLGSVVSSATAVTAKPLSPTVGSPITGGSTTVSGAAAAAGANVQLFVNGSARGASVAANGAGQWTVVGLSPAVAVGDGVTARQTVNGVQSDSSAAVVVIAGTPVLTSIVVTPANATLAAGGTQAYTATGFFSDGSSSDVSAQVVWLSTAPSVASITAAGLATALDAGPAMISATKGAISGSTSLTVTPPVVASIVVTPATPSILSGQTQPFTVTGVLTDGTSRSLAGQVTWSSTNPAAATINSGSGVALGGTGGSTNITATLGSISGFTSLNVTAVVSDGTPPTAAITSPANNATITSPIDVIGTANDANFLKYVLELAPAGTSSFTTFAAGTSPVVAGVLGKFDPTTLLNDLYTVRLTVFDKGGNSTVASTLYSVTRDDKVGFFTLAFEDVRMPAPGLPVTVIRVYDSREKRVGDFGAGWKLDLRSLTVRANRVQGTGWQVTKSGGFIPTYALVGTDQHKVSVTLPGGKVEEFDLVFNPASQQLVPLDFTTAAYTPRPGTVGTLRIVGNDGAFVNGSQPGTVEILDDSTFDTFDPTTFEYVSSTGTAFVVDKVAGVQSVRDVNGNSLSFGPGGIVHSSGRSLVFTRDSQGRITTLKDSNNNVHTYAYDANGDLSRYTDPIGNVTRFFYNLSHGLIEVRDPRGLRGLRNDYDANGRLVRTTDAAGKTIDYQHDLNTRQEIITDRLGHSSLFEYDTAGNVVRTTDPLGGVTLRSYDAQGNLVGETNAIGKSISRTYDARNNRLTDTDPLGKITTYTYNARNQTLTQADPLGHVTTNVYDANGNLTSTTDAAGKTTLHSYDARGNRTSITDPLGSVTGYQYDAAGNVTRETDPLGNVTTYTYDANGNRLSETRTQTTPGGPRAVVTQFEYDQRNRLTKITFADGTSARTTYNSISKQASTFDQLGRETRYEYDDVGQLTKTTFPDGTSELSTYDAESRRLSATDRAGRVTLFEYDALARLTKTTNPDGTFTTTAYDAIGNTLSATDALGHVTSYAYDAANHRTSITDALLQVTTFTYDAAANQVSTKDAKGNTTQYQYDNNNRRLKTVYPDATNATVAYDAVGRTTSKTDQAGQTTTFEYDKLGRLLKVTDALAHQTSYTYDELGDRVSQLDANGHLTRFEYDAMGRRTRRLLPLGMAETLTYDAAGNLASRTDFNGKTTTYTYDAVNRLTSKVPDASLGEPTVQYSFGPTGNRTQMIDASGTTNYSYDLQDRVLSKATPQGTLTYTYAGTGVVTSVRSSNAGGTSVDYGYDVLNRVTTVTDNRLAAGTTTYAYDAVGSLAGVHYPNGVQHSYTYNTLNRLTALQATNTATTIATYNYTLGPAGNRTSGAELGGRRADYTYDALYRLTGETISGALVAGAIGYQYDSAGNRTTRTSTVGPIGPAVYAYDTNDRLGGSGYDANGNTIAAGATYAYDFENRLTSVNGGVVAIVYDGDGNRAAKTVGGVTTRYLVDDRNLTGYAQVLEEIVGGVVQRAYTYGLTRVSQRQASGPSFYGYDGHGDVRLLTDAAGLVTDTYDYDAFGNLLSSTGTTPNDYLYAGELFDRAFGMYFNRARYYDARIGRFLTGDPVENSIFDPPSLHRYTYARNDPANRIDPAGTQEFSLGGLAVSMAIGGTLNAISGFNAQEGFLGVIKNFAIGAVEGGAFYFAGGFVFKYLARLGQFLASTRAAEAAATVFTRVARAGPLWEGLSLPKYFSLTTKFGEEVFFTANATEHMAQYLARAEFGAAGGTRFASALMIQQAEAVLAEATAGDVASIVGRKILLNVAGVPWEVVIEESTVPGSVRWVVTHLLFKGTL